jgi:hypothetical protein
MRLPAAAGFFASNPAPDDPRANPVCLQKLLPYSYEFDARAGGLDLKVPYFVIQGRNDPRCSPEAARAFGCRKFAPPVRAVSMTTPMPSA